ncbi:hypothetical protein V8C44DRAFT_333709 [Trichoderma aethiopicum]
MPKGIVTVECNRAECLTRLAPAVFSMPYLKSRSAAHHRHLACSNEKRRVTESSTKGGVVRSTGDWHGV